MKADKDHSSVEQKSSLTQNKDKRSLASQSNESLLEKKIILPELEELLIKEDDFQELEEFENSMDISMDF